MFEKVNPMHPDKLCDRIAGAMVDLAYEKEEDPKIAVEVLLGHGYCHIIAESSVHISYVNVKDIVRRIAGDLNVDYLIVPQDTHLADNQEEKIRCGDNGIFKGMPVTAEQKKLTYTAEEIYTYYPYDGKYILDGDRLIICQSNANSHDLMDLYPGAEINPLGAWTGGPDVDAGATNRKLGSDMADSVTGGGLHGKDLSKADVSVNIYCWLKAQETGLPVELSCAIGDEHVGDVSYVDIVDTASAIQIRIVQRTILAKKALSGKVYCGYCGSVCRSDTKRDDRIWCCKVRSCDRHACQVKNIKESQLIALADETLGHPDNINMRIYCDIEKIEVNVETVTYHLKGGESRTWPRK